MKNLCLLHSFPTLPVMPRTDYFYYFCFPDSESRKQLSEWWRCMWRQLCEVRGPVNHGRGKPQSNEAWDFCAFLTFRRRARLPSKQLSLVIWHGLLLCCKAMVVDSQHSADAVEAIWTLVHSFWQRKWLQEKAGVFMVLWKESSVTLDECKMRCVCCFKTLKIITMLVDVEKIFTRLDVLWAYCLLVWWLFGARCGQIVCWFDGYLGPDVVRLLFRAARGRLHLSENAVTRSRMKF